MNNQNPAFSMFTGTVDDLLKNMDKVDCDQVERVCVTQSEDYILDDEEAISMIMAESHTTRDEAVDILAEIKRLEIQRLVDNLVAEGLVEVSSYDKDGQPIYSLTDNGKVLANNLKKK
jgi:hypothetical protein